MSMRFWFGDASLSLGNVKAYYTLWPDVKNKKKGHVVFFVCSCVYLFGRLFVCVSYFFSFVCFSVSLLFNDRCCNQCQNLDEYFETNPEK